MNQNNIFTSFEQVPVVIDAKTLSRILGIPTMALCFLIRSVSHLTSALMPTALIE